MKVFVENLEFVGPHGVYPQEREEGRLFRVDVGAHFPDTTDSDLLADTLDYRRLANIVLRVGLGDSVQLVETLGRGIVALVFAEHPEVGRVEVTIRKKASGVAGDPEWVGVSIDTTRDDWRGA